MSADRRLVSELVMGLAGGGAVSTGGRTLGGTTTSSETGNNRNQSASTWRSSKFCKLTVLIPGLRGTNFEIL